MRFGKIVWSFWLCWIRCLIDCRNFEVCFLVFEMIVFCMFGLSLSWYREWLIVIVLDLLYLMCVMILVWLFLLIYVCISLCVCVFLIVLFDFLFLRMKVLNLSGFLCVSWVLDVKVFWVFVKSVWWLVLVMVVGLNKCDVFW